MQSKNKARRLILRSLVLGGSATAATKLLPESWVSPVVKSVMSPAHAGMSVGMDDDDTMGEMPTGVFQTDEILVNNQSTSPVQSFARSAHPDQSVLDYFIKPASAGMISIDDCPTEFIDSLQFSIPENPGKVDICLYSGQALLSDIDGTTIDDFSYNDLSFNNVVASDSEVTGNVEYLSKANVICTLGFTAPLVDDVFDCGGGNVFISSTLSSPTGTS